MREVVFVVAVLGSILVFMVLVMVIAVRSGNGGGGATMLW